MSVLSLSLVGGLFTFKGGSTSIRIFSHHGYSYSNIEKMEEMFCYFYRGIAVNYIFGASVSGVLKSTKSVSLFSQCKMHLTLDTSFNQIR